jgi:ADP-ribose pyrophosphatase YjhB (NUDIX family)
VSLNPALEQTRFCPRCGVPGPRIEFPRSLACDACGFVAYSNPSPVAAAIPRERETNRLILLRRGFDPGKGLWTFPGGFVDLGESVEDAARREVREELQLDVDLGELIGVYSRAQDRVVLVVFDALALNTPRPTPEAPEVEAFPPADLPWHELAFWSTALALRDTLSSSR